MINKENIKWLDTEVMYPMLDNKSISLVQCLQKKGVIIVVPIEHNELISIRLVIDWCMNELQETELLYTWRLFSNALQGINAGLISWTRSVLNF